MEAKIADRFPITSSLMYKYTAIDSSKQLISSCEFSIDNFSGKVLQQIYQQIKLLM